MKKSWFFLHFPSLERFPCPSERVETIKPHISIRKRKFVSFFLAFSSSSNMNCKGILHFFPPCLSFFAKFPKVLGLLEILAIELCHLSPKIITRCSFLHKNHLFSHILKVSYLISRYFDGISRRLLDFKVTEKANKKIMSANWAINILEMA